MRLSAAARPHRSLATLGMTVVLIELFLAHRFFGFLTGDDVEVLEEAFRRAIGFPFSPWDSLSPNAGHRVRGRGRAAGDALSMRCRRACRSGLRGSLQRNRLSSAAAA